MRASRRPRLGQNFLSSPRTAARIVDALAAPEGSWVVEVGPGRGALTRPLLARGVRIVAIEVDPRLAARLREELGGEALHVVEADALAFDPAAVLAEAGAEPPVPLVANLPYESATPMVRAFARRPSLFSRLVVMVQREVAERIVARPPGMSLLAVSVQLFGAPRIVARVPAGAFYPPPKVDSAIVRIDVYPQPAEGVTDVAGFFTVVRAGFGQKRKQLRNSLSQGLRRPAADIDAVLRAASIDPTRRAETLTLADWARLQHTLRE